METKPFLVLGVGNPLWQDDGFGIAVAQRLLERGVPPDADVIDGGTMGVYLLPYLEGRDAVIVVDAVHNNAPPGEIIRLAAADVPRLPGLRLSEHQVTMQEVLTLTDLMESRPRDFLFFGCQPGSLQWGEPLSEPVEAAIPMVVEQVLEQLRCWREDFTRECRERAVCA